MTDSSEVEAIWAIEIERDGGPVDYYSAIGIKATKTTLEIVTTSKERVTFKTDKIRKVLVMRAKDKISA